MLILMRVCGYSRQEADSNALDPAKAHGKASQPIFAPNVFTLRPALKVNNKADCR